MPKSKDELITPAYQVYPSPGAAALAERWAAASGKVFAGAIFTTLPRALRDIGLDLGLLSLDAEGFSSHVFAAALRAGVAADRQRLRWLSQDIAWLRGTGVSFPSTSLPDTVAVCLNAYLQATQGCSDYWDLLTAVGSDLSGCSLTVYGWIEDLSCLERQFLEKAAAAGVLTLIRPSAATFPLNTIEQQVVPSSHLLQAAMRWTADKLSSPAGGAVAIAVWGSRVLPGVLQRLLIKRGLPAFSLVRTPVTDTPAGRALLALIRWMEGQDSPEAVASVLDALVFHPGCAAAISSISCMAPQCGFKWALREGRRRFGADNTRLVSKLLGRCIGLRRKLSRCDEPSEYLHTLRTGLIGIFPESDMALTVDKALSGESPARALSLVPRAAWANYIGLYLGAVCVDAHIQDGVAVGELSDFYGLRIPRMLVLLCDDVPGMPGVDPFISEEQWDRLEAEAGYPGLSLRRRVRQREELLRRVLESAGEFTVIRADHTLVWGLGASVPIEVCSPARSSGLRAVAAVHQVQVASSTHLEETMFSATAMERYAECPYRFYLEHELGTEDRGHRFSFWRGISTHRALHYILNEGVTLSDAVERALREEGLLQVVGLSRAVEESLLFTEHLWLPVHGAELVSCEYEFGLTEPVVIYTGQTRLAFRGVIDRLERLRDGSLLVTDFKTGSKKAKRDAFSGGRSLQVALYMMIASMMEQKDLSLVNGRYVYISEVKADVVPFSGAVVKDRQGEFYRLLDVLAEGIRTAQYFPRKGSQCYLCPYAEVCTPGRDQVDTAYVKRFLEVSALP